MNQYSIIKDFIKQYKWKYLAGIISVLVVDILQLILPKLFGNIADELQMGDITVKRISYYIVIIVLLSFAIMIFRFLYNIYIFGTEKKLEYALRKKLFDHLLTLSTQFYNTHKTGDLMAHATNDINAIRMAMGTGMLLSIDTIFLTVTTLIIIITTIDFRLTLFALLPLPTIAIGGIRFGKLIEHRFTEVQEAFSTLTDRVQESLSGIRVIKAYVQEKGFLQKFNEASFNAFKKNMNMAKLWGLSFPAVQLIATLSFIIVLGYGGIQVMLGQISLGDFVAFNTYLGMLIWPMMAFGWVINLIQQGTASLHRINSILSYPTEIQDKNPLNIQSIKGHIRFENVTFTYPGAIQPALKNINIEVLPGKTLAIVGGTGSGKTTLVNLILRLYEAQEGSVLIDEIPIDKIPLSVLRTSTGYVPQDTFLFSTTIKDNIAFGSDTASMESILKVSQMAQIYENIMDFPKGFETVVGERGVTLSGGQKQRISIARALLMDPKILILDDALSAVDTHTEEKILQHLKEVMKQRTSIIISHRISTVQHADEIIFLEDGEIVERGTHQQLLQKNGRYAALYQKQLLEEEISKTE